MITIDKNTPTSDLLEIEVGFNITDGNKLKGYVTEIKISDTDEFWLFLFSLDNGNQIEIMKIKNIC